LTPSSRITISSITRLVSLSNASPDAALTSFALSARKNVAAAAGSTPANSGAARNASGPWNTSHAALLASTLAHARVIISRSKLAIALGIGARASHDDSPHASNSAELAPMPLNGLIGCAASPIATTRELGFAPLARGGDGLSRSYSGPAQTSSQSVCASMSWTGACQDAVSASTNAFAPAVGCVRGAAAIAQASSSVTLTLICHMFFHIAAPGEDEDASPSASVAELLSVGGLKGIVNILARRPSRV